jgi:hypothetical protein
LEIHAEPKYGNDETGNAHNDVLGDLSAFFAAEL